MILKNRCMILKDIAPSKKASKKCEAFKNIEANDLNKEASNTPKILNEV